MKTGQKPTILIIASLFENLSLTILSHSRQSRIVSTFDSRILANQFASVAATTQKSPEGDFAR
jgi:hypothetical protein